MSTTSSVDVSSLQREMDALNQAKRNPMPLEQRMEIEDRIFEIKQALGLVVIDRESSMFECVGCGS